MSSSPYSALSSLPPKVFREVWLETVIQHGKWDPQIGDTFVLADFPLLLSIQAWQEISGHAERLAAEALAAEAEMLRRADLHAALGLSDAIRKAWRHPEQVCVGTPGDVRIIRFDFHYTPAGWCISEANIDTPGGLIESSGFTASMLARYPGPQISGDPPRALAQAIRQVLPSRALVALIHATAYSDDRQMMIYLQRMLEQEGLRTCLISPAQLRWQDGVAAVATDWEQGQADYLVRFFPAEWLPGLPDSTGWRHYFERCQLPASNPTSALLVQSKRFPLVWDRLETRLPTWRALLPETCDPRAVGSSTQDGWVYKPVFGRAGEKVLLKGVTEPGVWDKMVKAARRFPGGWIAQRRFETVPVQVNGISWYPSVGVYTVNGRAAGIYGRVAEKPLINDTAKDMAVFIGD